MSVEIIGPDTLAFFRSINEGAMPSACDLIAFAQVRGPGGVTDRTAIVVVTVPCRVSLASSGLPVIAAQLTPAGQYVVTLPYGTDVSGIERLTVRGPDGAAPLWTANLNVAGLDEPRSFAASVRVRATLSDDTAITPSDVATIVVTEG